MVDKLRRLADLEQRWGGLTRWLLSILFFLVLGSALHFADIRYVRRDEFAGLMAKLDALIAGQSATTQHVLDIERRLDRMEDSRPARETVGEPRSFAGQ